MRLIDTDRPPRPDEAMSESGLMAAVKRLVECLAVDVPMAEVNAAARAAMARAGDAERRLAEQMDRLHRLERQALTDPLTGLLNRRGIEAELARAMAAATRYGEKGVLVFADLDGFKPVNDTYGHAAGDAVLAHVGALLAANVRATDAVGRMGGDEFAVVLTRTTGAAGLERAEAFDTLINGATAEWSGRAIAVRASFGFQTYGPGDDLGRLLASADRAMYETKRARAAAPRRRASA